MVASWSKLSFFTVSEKPYTSKAVKGFVAILINIPFLFTDSWKWNTINAPRKTSIGRFIHLMNFYFSLDIQMYPKYPHFWAFWSSQHSHRCCICPLFMFVPQSRSISLLYRILSVYFSSFYQNKSTKINLCVG